MTDTRPRWYTAPEVADLLRVGKQTIYRLIQSGAIDAVHIRRTIRIPAAAVDALIERGTA